MYCATLWGLGMQAHKEVKYKKLLYCRNSFIDHLLRNAEYALADCFVFCVLWQLSTDTFQSFNIIILISGHSAVNVCVGLRVGLGI